MAKELLPILPWATIEQYLKDAKNAALAEDTDDKSNGAEEEAGPGGVGI